MVTRFKRLPESCCPKCGSTEVIPARGSSFGENLASLVGFQAANCHNCAHRFLARPFAFEKLRFAKCPSCYGMVLSTWDLKYYNVGWWTKLKIALGARRWRCGACRRNFVSFRPRHPKYVRAENDTGEGESPV